MVKMTRKGTTWRGWHSSWNTEVMCEFGKMSNNLSSVTNVMITGIHVDLIEMQTLIQ
jgi:hypothetical protein